MMKRKVFDRISPDTSDLIFRLLFSAIFLGLGIEHLFFDELLQRLMPSWFPAKRLLSILSGIVLITGGSMVLLGYRLRIAALLLGSFLILVTTTVHLPSLFVTPSFISTTDQWLWAVLQRSNFAKNLCLLGICFHLLHYSPGRYRLQYWKAQSRLHFRSAKEESVE